MQTTSNLHPKALNVHPKLLNGRSKLLDAHSKAWNGKILAMWKLSHC